MVPCSPHILKWKSNNAFARPNSIATHKRLTLPISAALITNVSIGRLVGHCIYVSAKANSIYMNRYAHVIKSLEYSSLAWPDCSFRAVALSLSV